MRFFALILVVVMALGATGCAKKTPEQQLADDMKKAGKQLNKDMQRIMNQ